ncbi:metallophosphoesterase [Seleniivibrio woodruffii]|uniref:Serine/threonine protein phosphatase 1 n=1 Tax=Seleniivibrio woodruffii TaxID=1078050 RepID=A0A4V2PS14_9BACT|nr:metallophosphoesterase [Seleniivibrio woodruffii]TCK60941.1 serine/threonine protein phosphatase 1 [Seleniivibrio woodruffii]TVZ36571.1 serine/threonine protein phosphatase 1 [Seleniivibrio woodruffii]
MPFTAVIGDIHGCIRTLDRLINRIEARYSDVNYISLGDIVDRGFHSLEVTELFMEMKKQGRFRMLLGNHEDMMLDYTGLSAVYAPNAWFGTGGKLTVSSFSRKELDNKLTLGTVTNWDFKPYLEPYQEFFDSAEMYFGYDYPRNKYMFSHAGLGPSNGKVGRVTEYSRRKDYLYIWTRDTEQSQKKHFGYTMVHGHTPVKKVDPQHNPRTPFVNRNKAGELVSVNLDTGCVYGYALSAMVIDDAGDFEFVSERCMD